MSSRASSSSSSVTPFQLIDKLLKTDTDKPDFDLNRLAAQIDARLLRKLSSTSEASKIADQKLRNVGLIANENPILKKLDELLSASEATNFEDQVSTIVNLIANEIKQYSGNKHQTSIGVLTAIEKFHWAAVGFLVVGAAVKIADTIEYNEECLRLFKSMNDLSKVILELQNLPDLKMKFDTELNKSISLIVEGAILCSLKERAGSERDGQELQQLSTSILHLQLTISALRGMQSNWIVSLTSNQDAESSSVPMASGGSISITIDGYQGIDASREEVDDVEPKELLEEVNAVMPNSSSAICIFKIDETYVPQHIGIGLYHHADSSSRVQNIKRRTLIDTVAKIHGMNETKLVEKVRGLLQRIKNCYEESEKYCIRDDREQAEKFTMDACFILEFFTDDKIRKREGNDNMMEDVFTFQNQIPLFILLDILKLKHITRAANEAAASKAAAGEFADGLIKYRPFLTFFPFHICPGENISLSSILKEALLKEQERDKSHHLLHLLSKSMKRFLSPNHPNTVAGTTAPIGCHHLLKKLDHYMKFKARNGEVSFVKILEKLYHYMKFEARIGEVLFEKRSLRSSIFYFPKITLDEDAMPLNRKLMKFGGLSRRDKFFCDLMYLMNCIVNPRNQSLFREEGIIQGNGENCYQNISTLCNGVTSDAGGYMEVIAQLEKHCKIGHNRWIHNVSDFFSRHASLLVASLGVVVAIVIGAMNYTKKE